MANSLQPIYYTDLLRWIDTIEETIKNREHVHTCMVSLLTDNISEFMRLDIIIRPELREEESIGN